LRDYRDAIKKTMSGEGTTTPPPHPQKGGKKGAIAKGGGRRGNERYGKHRRGVYSILAQREMR